jgi:hypothetical protein
MDKQIAPDPLFDSTIIQLSPASIFLEPVVDGNRAVYTYIVQDDSTEWLHLIYNKDPVLRYKLNVKGTIYGH